MPEICRFYGIVIKMFFKPKEHEPSHLHALYGEHIGIFDLKTMKMTEGDLPTRAQQLVQEWMSAHQDKLLEMWDTQKLEKLPPLLWRCSYAAKNQRSKTHAGLLPAHCVR